MNSSGLALFDSTVIKVTDLSGTQRSFPVRIAGSGPPILFVHGFPLDSRMWEPLMARLSAKYRCIAPDLRGFGQCSEEPTSFSLGDLAQDLHGLLHALGVQQKVTLCGLSMGGYVAMRFVDLFPEQVSRVILSNTRANADDEAGRKTRRETAVKALVTSAPETVGPMFEKLLSDKSRKFEPELAATVQDMLNRTFPSTIAWAQLAMAERPDSIPEMRHWTQPTLCVVGEHDKITPPECAVEMSQTIPYAHLSIDSTSAHMTPMESPDWFANQIHNAFSL